MSDEHATDGCPSIHPDPCPQQMDHSITDDEGKNCIICFEPYTNDGDHRLVCLKCGHLFGKICIEKHLGNTRNCPICKKTAHKKDLRKIYAKCIELVDTTEVERLSRDLKLEKDSRCQIEYDLALERKRIITYQDENSTLRMKLAKLDSVCGDADDLPSTSGFSLAAKNGFDSSIFTSGASQQPATVAMPERIHFAQVYTCELDDCRVMAFCQNTSWLAVSCKAPPGPWKGFGIKLFNLQNESCRYMPIHAKTIRDVSFKPDDNSVLLSVGMDSMLHLTNLTNNSVICGVALPSPGWCCAWAPGNTVVVGCQNGKVYRIDMDHRDTDLEDITEGSVTRSPVCAIHWVENQGYSGVTVAKAKDVIFYEKGEGGFRPHILCRCEGTITSLCYVGHSPDQFLVTARPENQTAKVTHQLFQIDETYEGGRRGYFGRMIHVLSSGSTQTRMTRNDIFRSPILPNNQAVISLFDEDKKEIAVYDSCSGSKRGEIKVGVDTMQVKKVVYKDRLALCVLNAKKIDIFEIRV